MIFVCIIISGLLTFFENSECSLVNNSAILISRYSKVAHWGQTRSSTERIPIEEGRSNSGQTLWTHRSDVNIVAGQNLRSDKSNVVYHYAVPKKQPSKLGRDRIEKVPGVGEVQERFNPKPYFDYAPVPSKQANLQSNNKKPMSPSFDSSPVFSKPAGIQDTLSDSYSSPYTSYNPPAINVEDSKNNVPVYPPNSQKTRDEDFSQMSTPKGYSYSDPNNNEDEGYDYKPAGKPQVAPGNSEEPSKQYASFGPPLAPPDDMSGNHGSDEHMFYPPNDQHGNDEVILDHPPPGYEDDNHHTPDGMQQAPPDMNNMNGNGDAGEGDLNPPPSDDNGKFPQYLYNGIPGHGYDNGHSFGAYDFDHHHVYEVVEHPTTTPAPHDERVNKGHYSYYYLGRKLWYIPLYFSVYFIIYVTILILKSIARHKIHLKHDFHDKLRKGREMDLDEKINDLHKNVTTAIYSVNKTYIM